MVKFSIENLDISNVTKSALPRALFVSIYKEIFKDNDYELSLSFVSKKEMRELSIKYKGDDTHMNVLSFPFSKKSGEIFVCTETAKKECADFGHGVRQHVKFLVIHGMLHLAGFVHGSKMEAEEKRLMKKFSI